MPLYPPAGTTLSDATPANVQPGVPDAGVATEASRDDHAHDASWSGVAPSASAPGDAAATGAAQGFNRRDHVHGRESYATIAANLKLDDLAAPDDNTDLNVSIAKHGLTPKLSNVSTEYLSGTGVYSAPAGGGAHAASHEDGGADEIDVTGLTGAGGSGAPPDCYEAFLAADVSITTAGTFQDIVSVSLPDGTYLVTGEGEATSASGSGTFVTMRIYDGTTVWAAKGARCWAGDAGGAANPSVSARVVVSGTTTVKIQGTSNRSTGDTIFRDQSQGTGTADKCTVMHAIKVTAA